MLSSLSIMLVLLQLLGSWMFMRLIALPNGIENATGQRLVPPSSLSSILCNICLRRDMEVDIGNWGLDGEI